MADLPFAGYQNNLFNTGGNNFFDDILNSGAVDNGQHLFWNSLGGRQKTCVPRPATGMTAFRDNHMYLRSDYLIHFREWCEQAHEISVI